MPAFTLRRATRTDLPAVVDLCMLVEEQHARYWPLRWERRPNQGAGWLRWLTARLEEPNMLILAAIAEATPDRGAVAGALLAVIEEEMPIYTYSHYGLIHDIAVAEAYRRQGVATALLRSAAEWAAERGVNQLRLLVAEQNPEAQALFAAAGFRPTYREMVLPLARPANG